MNTLIRILVTLASAGVLSLISTPVEWWWFHPIVYLPMLLWVVRDDRPRANLLYGWLYGAFGVALIFRWLVDTIDIFSDDFGFVSAVGVLALFGAVFGAPWALVWWALPAIRRTFGAWWVAVFPALIVLVDWVSSFILLFPFQHGVTLYRVPALWQLLSVTGIWGPTWLVFAWNTALADAWLRARDRTPRPWLAPALITGLTLAIAGWGTARVARLEAALREAPTLRIAQLQSPNGMEWRMTHRARDAWEEWIERTRRVPPGSVDLVVWPEASSPYDLNTDERAAEAIERLAREGQYGMLIGSGAREGEVDLTNGKKRERNFNSVYFVSPGKGIEARYDKMVPLPFGEYVPLAEVLPIPHIDGIGDFKAGTEPVVWDSGKARMAAPICYEAILGRVCRRFGDLDLLVNGTNDAWFGDTAAPHQHAMLAAERATELGIPMYRSAYTGISMAVEPHGHIHAETEPFTEVARIVTVRLARFETIYARFGDWFVGACGLVLAAGWLARRRSPSSASGSSPATAAGVGAP